MLFFFLEYSWPIWVKLKRFKKFEFFYQSHGLNPLEKSRFLDFFNLLILESKNAFFLSRMIIIKCIFLSDFAIKKMEKLTKTNPFGKIPVFQFFSIFIFIVLKLYFPF